MPANTSKLLVVDAANVVGSRPTGWWKDRAGAARNLHTQLVSALEAGRLEPGVVLVLEGKARDGVPENTEGDLHVVHAGGSGDDAIVALVEHATGDGDSVTVVTADRELRDRAQRLDASVVGPKWLLELLGALGT